jgi:hypothetical protein
MHGEDFAGGEFDHRDVVVVGEREDAFAGVRGAQLAVATFENAATAKCGCLGRSGPVKLVDRSQVLVGEVFACGRKALENRVQQRHRDSGALLNLAYEL